VRALDEAARTAGAPGGFAVDQDHGALIERIAYAAEVIADGDDAEAARWAVRLGAALAPPTPAAAGRGGPAAQLGHAGTDGAAPERRLPPAVGHALGLVGDLLVNGPGP
jgi:hypothetical protein